MPTTYESAEEENEHHWTGAFDIPYNILDYGEVSEMRRGTTRSSA